MYKNNSFLAIIPARGGSKRLKNKNLLSFSGKPLIAWSIEAGLKSKYLDEVMVTTDSTEIMKISEKYGAKVPFKRPANLATDNATRFDTILHTVNFYKKNNKNFDYIIYLQPTSPLREAEHIDAAIEYMFLKNADAVISVCEVEHPIQWTGTLPTDSNMSKFLSNVEIKTRSQDLEKHYRLNGAIYITKLKRFLEDGCLAIKDNIYAFKMDRKVSVDIDNEEDLIYAEILKKKKLED